MAKTAIMRKQMGSLVPMDSQGEDLLKAIQQGVDVKVTVTQSRNIKAHRLYWKMCGMVAQNTDDGWTDQNVSDLLKIATGHYSVTKGRQGQEYKIPKSIDFASMGQEEFGPFLDRCIAMVCERIIPGLPESEFRRELETITGMRI